MVDLSDAIDDEHQDVSGTQQHRLQQKGLHSNPNGPYMAIYVHIWTIYDHIWTIYGHIWAIYVPCMVHIWDIYGPYMVIYGTYMAIYGSYMAIYGSYMAIYGPFMATYGPYMAIYIYGPYNHCSWPWFMAMTMG